MAILDGMSLLRLFGHPALERDGVRSSVGVPAKAVVLAALLAANASRPLSREWLAQTLWPDLDPSEGRANLRRHVHLLGKALGEEPFLLARHTAQWNAACRVSVDVIRFDEFAQTDPALAIEEYAGELCTGVDDEALEALRARYRFTYEALLRERIGRARAAGDDAQLSAWLQRAVNHDPYDEAAVRQIMELRVRHGDRTGALREFNALAQRLRSELDAEPSKQTAQLYTDIAGAGGDVRAPNNLPNPATTFVGRERELGEVIAAIRARRLVSLTGAGGIGKSRLALRAAFDLLPEYPHGVWLVSLEHARTEAAIWEQMLAALRLPLSASPDRAVLESLKAAPALIVLDTCEHVVDRARSVVERLLSETNTHVLATSRRKLNLAPEQNIAVQPLEMPPEAPGEVTPMRFAAYRLFIERATAISPAFRVEPRQTRALREVLARTDGLPLAIELVASRANVLTIEGMRKRLATAMRGQHRSPASARAQTIHDTIAWSYDLLSASQRRIFRFLSAFAGAFDLEDAEQLCGDLEDVPESVFELVDASLLSLASTGPQVRYRLLDTTREFAGLRLAESADAAAAHRRHAELFASRAGELAALEDQQFPYALRGVAEMMPNYLAAMSAAASHDWPDLGLRLLEGLHRFGYRHHFADELLERALTLSRCPSLSATHRARLARLAGMLAEATGQYALSREQSEIAAQHYREQADEERLCDALSGIAIMEFHLGRYEQCERRLIEIRERTGRDGNAELHVKTLGRLGALYLAQARFEEAVPLLEAAALPLSEMGQIRQAAIALKNLATAAHYAGRQDDAIRWADQALAHTRSTSELGMHALALCLRASAEREAGRVQASLRSFVEASEHFPSLGESADLAECLEDVASTLAVCGEEEPAARILGFTEHLRARIGSPQNPGLQHYTRRTAAALAEMLGSRRTALAETGAQETPEGIHQSANQALRKALAGMTAAPR